MLALITAGALVPAVVSAQDECLGCHAQLAGVPIAFPDGSSVQTEALEGRLESSVHRSLTCTDCHRSISGYPHRTVEESSARDYQHGQAQTCNRCHYAYYTKALDGIHYRMLAEGRMEAPNCVDCHGAHGVTPPGEPRVKVDLNCARCHAEVARVYESSVHGRALLEEDAVDVPVCTDCHGAHSIADPRQPGFRAREHEICATCHGDKEKMERYGLNPMVAST